MKKNLVRHIGILLAIYLVAVVLWRLWIPNLTSFEAPGWDESDRAHDALVVFRAFAHFNPLPFLSQLVLFQTWGPLFAVFAQVPLFLFGVSAQSLTFVSFSGLVFASLGTFVFVRARLGWWAAAATSLFTFFWLVGAPRFGPYFVIMMLESWVIVGWLGIAVAGALSDVTLLIAASWILFAAKYQYYPIFFVTFVISVLWGARRKLISFTKEFVRPTCAKVLLGVITLLVLHVSIMKALGPIYGQVSWNQPRALRNPVLFAFICGTILLYLRREAIFSYLIELTWVEKYAKWFFWPATVLMAFPWPNRWAGVMVTQSYQAESRTFAENLAFYAREVIGSLQTPEATLGVLATLLLILPLGLAIGMWRARKRGLPKLDLKSLPTFVVFTFLMQIAVLLVAVKNTQPRFAFAVFLSVPVGLFVYALMQLTTLIRQITGGLLIVLILAIFTLTDYFYPTSFFLSSLHDHTNETYFTSTELYPLDRSLGPIVMEASKKIGNRAVRFGLIQATPDWLWDRPMQLWPLEFELHTGVPSQAFIYQDSANVCAAAKDDQLDLLLRPGTSSWEMVTCPSIRN